MSYNPEIFTAFLYDTLSTDAAITALVTGVYTYTLQETQTPYVVINIDNIRPLNASSLNAQEVEFSLNCYSSEAGYSELFDISEKLFAAMQDKTATLTGYKVVNTRFIDSRFERMTDGKGVTATLEFRSVIQQN